MHLVWLLFTSWRVWVLQGPLCRAFPEVGNQAPAQLPSPLSFNSTNGIFLLGSHLVVDKALGWHVNKIAQAWPPFEALLDTQKLINFCYSDYRSVGCFAATLFLAIISFHSIFMAQVGVGWMDNSKQIYNHEMRDQSHFFVSTKIPWSNPSLTWLRGQEGNLPPQDDGGERFLLTHLFFLPSPGHLLIWI